MNVRIIKSWTYPDLLRQTPGNTGRWGGITFTLDPIPDPDYLVVLNHIPRETTVTVAPSRIWCFIQEPPEPIYRWMEKAYPRFARIHTQDTRHRASSRIIHTHGSLPWHIDRTYDQLSAIATPPAKTGDLSWITSNLAVTPGHRRRLAFLEKLRAARIPFDLYGRGFNPIADKYDGLAPYRYALSIEKMTCGHYWTEKLADCFLAWTMPIYYGATKLEDYFPKNSFVRIDIDDPDAPRQVADIIRSDRAERHRDAIAEARRRVLEEHNLFPRLARLIHDDLRSSNEEWRMKNVESPNPAERQSPPSSFSILHSPLAAAQPQRLTLPANIDLTRYYIEHTPLQRALRSIRRRVVSSE